MQVNSVSEALLQFRFLKFSRNGGVNPLLRNLDANEEDGKVLVAGEVPNYTALQGPISFFSGLPVVYRIKLTDYDSQFNWEPPLPQTQKTVEVVAQQHRAA